MKKRGEASSSLLSWLVALALVVVGIGFVDEVSNNGEFRQWLETIMQEDSNPGVQPGLGPDFESAGRPNVNHPRFTNNR